MRPSFRRSVVAATLLSLVLPAAASAGRREPQLPPHVLEAKEQAKLAAAAKEPAPTKPIEFDCDKTGLQAVVDAAKDGDIIELIDMCTESVRVDHKRLTLRGSTKAEFDGRKPHGIQNPGPFPAVTFTHSPAARLEGLKITGAGAGVFLSASQATMQDCDVSNNTASGVVSVDATNLMAVGLTIENNARAGFQAARGSTAFCDQCEITGNVSWQAISGFQSLVSIRDSVVAGVLGLNANVNSFIDHDCYFAGTTHPCTLNATRFASVVDSESVMTYIDSRDFTGAFQAFNGGTVHLLGARQQALGTAPNGSPRINYLDVSSTLTAYPWEDDDGTVTQSRLLETALSGFTEALLFSETEVAGPVGCDSAADLWAEPSIVIAPGGSISNCEHYAPPGP